MANILVTHRKKGPNIGLWALLLLSIAYCWHFSQPPMLWLGLAAAALSAAALVKARYDPRIILRIDDSGIFDDRLGVGKIFWNDVESVQLQMLQEKSFLCVRVKDPQIYLKRLSGSKSRRAEQNQKLGFTTFNIDISAVNVSPLDLKKFVDLRIEACPYGQLPERVIPLSGLKECKPD